MATLHVEQQVRDYKLWKQMFDSDPAQRKQNGVRAYRIAQRTDDPNYIVIDMDFDSTGAAQAFLTKLKTVWQSPQGQETMGSELPQSEIIETVESKSY